MDGEAAVKAATEKVRREVGVMFVVLCCQAIRLSSLLPHGDSSPIYLLNASIVILRT